MNSTSVNEWWKEDEQKKQDVALSAYIIWHIWKERGRQIFQNVNASSNAVVGLIKADLDLLLLAKSAFVT